MRFIFIVSLFLISLPSMAQQYVKYGGMVYDLGAPSHEEYSIVLRRFSDSLVYKVQTDADNQFVFNRILTGQYERCVLWGLDRECDTVHIYSSIEDEVVFIRNEQTLDEVIISANASKDLIKNQGGVLIVNIEDNPIWSSGNTFESLTKMPGVSYNASEDLIKLKGKSGVQIQIDGEPLLLSSSEISEYLKTLSADNIKEIELESNPSSKQDASGIAGIINIVTKKNTREGFFTSVFLSGTQGDYFRKNTNARLQYNINKNQFLFQFNNSYNKTSESASTFRNFSTLNTIQDTRAVIKGNTNTFNFGYSRELDKSSLSLTAITSFYSEGIVQMTHLDFRNNSNVNIDSSMVSSQNSANKLENIHLNLRYNLELEKAKLSLRSYYLKYDIDNHSTLRSKSALTNLALINESPKKVGLFVSQIDYVQVLDSLSKLDFGIKGVYQKLQNSNSFYDINSVPREFDSEKSNDFRYTEWVLSAFSEYKLSLSKTDITVGVRLEYNPLDGYNSKNDYAIVNDKLFLFPFLNLVYKHSENSDYNLSYSKRIRRPAFNQMMPFDYYMDPFTILSGNPDLVANLVHSLDFQYILKQKYIFGLNYSLNKNQFFHTPILDETKNTAVLKPLNLERGYSVSVFNNSSFKLFNKLDLNINSILFYNRFNSANNEILVDSDKITYQFTVNGSYKIFQNYNLNVSVDYLSPFVQGPYKTEKIVSLNTSVSKVFLSDKMRVSLVGNDILGSYRIHNRFVQGNQSVYSRQRFDTQWVRLGLSYRFERGLRKQGFEYDATVDEYKSRI